MSDSQKKSGRRLVLALLLLLGFFAGEILASRSQARAADLQLLTPRAGGTVVARKAETHLVLRQTASSQTVKVRVGKSDVVLLPVVVEQIEEHNYLHYRVPLKPGLNSFVVEPGGQRFEFKYRPVQADLNPNSLGKDVYLFHQDDQLPKSCAECHSLQKTRTIEPFGLVQQTGCASCHQNVIDHATWQHGPAASRQCLSCHLQTSRPWRIGFPTAKTEDICFSCHTGKSAWRTKKFIHGPLNVGGCNLCHAPHGENHRYQLWAEGSVALCLACHSEKENLVRKEKPLPYVHGIIKGMGCVACHDPHATDQQFLLSKPVNELCVGCHTGLAGVTRGHPVGGHPVSAPKERRRPNRELNCTSCHDPHGSRYAHLLIGDSRGGKICIACHK